MTSALLPALGVTVRLFSFLPSGAHVPLQATFQVSLGELMTLGFLAVAGPTVFALVLIRSTPWLERAYAQLREGAA